MTDMIEYKKGFDLVNEWANGKKVKIFNEKSLEIFADEWEKYEKDNTMKNAIMNEVKSIIEPLAEQNRELQIRIDKLITTSEIKQEIEKRDKNKDDVTAYEEKKELSETDKAKPSQKEKWEYKRESDKIETFKYRKHTITVISDDDGNKVANIDDGKNYNIKSDKDIDNLKKTVEKMENE